MKSSNKTAAQILYYNINIKDLLGFYRCGFAYKFYHGLLLKK